MMFKIPIPTKKKQYTEELIKILEMYGTVKLQNEFLHEQIKELQIEIRDLKLDLAAHIDGGKH